MTTLAKVLRSVVKVATVAAVALAGATVNAQSGAPGSEIRVANGVLRGSPRDTANVAVFKGIPYAAPPIGDLRWHAPRPAASWAVPRDATRFGKRCLSALTNDPEPGPPRSEDCLTLNVWTAAQPGSAKRPVMVWFHGGGFQFGSSANPALDGSALAQKGAVVVTFNYRLGVLGFLAHPDLDREGPSGNYGLQDQLAALRWVQANIAAFGGDPRNVTLFGESAGAHAIGILMASPLSRGLFHKAIGESGSFWEGKNGPMESYDEARSRGVAFAGKIGATSIAALRAMPAEALNAAAPWNFKMNPMVTTFSPNVDRHVVPQAPAGRYFRRQQMKIPLLAGWNAVEGYPFDGIGLPHATAAQFRAAAEQMFGKARMAEFLKLYPADSDAQANASALELTGDIVIVEQTWKWLELQHAAGAPVFGYKFTYTSPYTPVAGHVAEVPFVFGTLTPQFAIGSRIPGGVADRPLAEKITSYWYNFAARGNPNGPGLPQWPDYGNSGSLLELGKTVAAIANPQRERLRFISSYRRSGEFPKRWRAIP